MSVNKYQSKMRNVPEDRRSCFHRDGSLKFFITYKVKIRTNPDLIPGSRSALGYGKSGVIALLKTFKLLIF